MPSASDWCPGSGEICTPGCPDYQPSPEALDRHRRLWDARLNGNPGRAELAEFGWWWSSGRFTEPGDVGRLARTLRASEGRVGDARSATAVLSELARRDPGLSGAIEVLEVIAETHSAAPQH